MRTSILLALLLLGLTGHSQIKTDSSETAEPLATPKLPYSKHSFSLNSIMNYPYFYGNHSNSLIDWGLKIEYIHSTSNRFGFGLEYGIDFSTLNLNTSYGAMFSFITTDDLDIDHEGIDILVQNMMPKIQWKTRHDTGNHGIYHQFGIGVSLTHALRKDYDYELNFLDPTSEAYLQQLPFRDPNDAEETYTSEQLYNYKNKPYWGGSIMYSLIYRGNITKSIQWSAGIRTQINLNIHNFKSDNAGSFGYALADQEDTMYWINRREMRDIIKKNRTESLFHLHLGITYKLANK